MALIVFPRQAVRQVCLLDNYCLLCDVFSKYYTYGVLAEKTLSTHSRSSQPDIPKSVCCIGYGHYNCWPLVLLPRKRKNTAMQSMIQKTLIFILTAGVTLSVLDCEMWCFVVPNNINKTLIISTSIMFNLRSFGA